MTLAGSVTADELVRALERRAATLPAEIATFVVLEGADAMLASGPRHLDGLSSVRISEQGSVSLSGAACDDARGARDLHKILTQLLAAAGPSLAPALSRLAAEAPRDDFGLRALRDELEAALVPLNRNASRRVLARFVRDAARPVPEAHEVDAAVSSLLRGEGPANDADKAAVGASERPPLQVDLFEGLDLASEEGHYLESAVALPGRERMGSYYPEPRMRSVRPSLAPVEDERESPPSLRPLTEELEEEDDVRPSGARRLFIAVALLALAVVAVAITLAMRSVERSPDTALAEPLRGDVIVRVAVPGAQVLQYVGDAPVTVSALPVSIAHEFVAIAPGHAPARVLVPADAEWEVTNEGPRFEVAMQLREDVQAQAGALPELGPSRLGAPPEREGKRLGAVRIVTTPRGARVYRLVGVSPEVRLRDLPRKEAHELLIYREGFVPVRRTVAAADFKPEGERHVASVLVSLSQR